MLPAAAIEGSPTEPELPAAGFEAAGVFAIALGLGRIRFESSAGSLAEDEAVGGGDEAGALERGTEGRLGGGKAVDAREDEGAATGVLDQAN